MHTIILEDKINGLEILFEMNSNVLIGSLLRIEFFAYTLLLSS